MFAEACIPYRGYYPSSLSDWHLTLADNDSLGLGAGAAGWRGEE